ncbi:MAG: hypothetical protein LUQ25_02265 [Methanoregulaceae archaeon]|nr:hypothetical protein [Methanoregulaceae archaeon]
MREKIALPASLVIITAVLLSGCAATGQGTLSGHVTIGPLCPVEPCHPTPEQIASAYNARVVNVFTLNQDVLITYSKIGPDGNYMVRLPPGSYIVDIGHIGIDRSTDVPAEVTIVQGQTTVLNITIDTGLR